MAQTNKPDDQWGGTIATVTPTRSGHLVIVQNAHTNGPVAVVEFIGEDSYAKAVIALAGTKDPDDIEA